MTAPWDVCVVGAGPSGVLAAEHLMGRGRRVLLLEAGERVTAGRRAPEVDRRQWPFSVVGQPYDWYRVRAVGGRTLIWGGWCHRFSDEVFARSGWPYPPTELARHLDVAEARLGVTTEPLSPRFAALGRELDLRVVPKRTAFARRRAVWTARQSSAARRARSLMCVTGLEHGRRHATAATAVDLRSGRTLRFAARAFVLAASPIETARILLMSRLGRAGRRIGRGLADHLVAGYVLIEPAPVPLRPGHAHTAPSALVDRFVNIGGDTEQAYPGGFTIELTGPVSLEALGLERMVPTSELATTRATMIHAIGEGTPHRGRYLDLDPDRRDAAGQPAPRLHVAWSAAERRMAADMQRACTHVADALAIPGSRLVKFTDPLTAGAGHEAGTCAMGVDDRSPADPWGRVRALDNVWVADASALPTPGDRHPTLTVLAHTLRAATDVDRYLG